MTARQSNQSVLKEINSEYSLEGLMLKLKLHYFDHLIQRASSLEKTLMLWKTEDRRRREEQRMRWLDGITELMGMSLSKLWKMVKGMEAWSAAVHGVTKHWTWPSDWRTNILMANSPFMMFYQFILPLSHVLSNILSNAKGELSFPIFAKLICKELHYYLILMYTSLIVVRLG